jgi:hypothetical protein
MIWVVIGIVTLILAGFILYLFGFRWGRMARHASVEVPGESVVELPAGRVAVYYEDGFRWRYSERARPWAGFSMLVSAEASGERLDLEPPEKRTTFRSRGRNRIPYGALDVPRAGRYKVSSQVDADAVDPRIIFG